MQHNDNLHPDEMAKEFTQLVEDLSYSKTFYPGSKITTYLNTEAGKRYLRIYENQKQSAKRVVAFFKYDLPLIIAKHQRILFLCFGLFVLFVAIGFFSAKTDENFVRSIMGDDYVDMTQKNIQDGNPFGVYGNGNEILSFLYIFINNMYVTLSEFAGGILLGFPTVKSLMTNSIMVGAFEYMFYSRGLMNNSLLVIMIHGTLELSTFVISAAAGLVIAKSWIFPGTRKRLDALKTGAKEGLVIAMATFPMLLVAAFFEGFITRHVEMPLLLKLLIIGSSLSFVIGYFIIYPIRLKRKINLAQQ